VAGEEDPHGSEPLTGSMGRVNVGRKWMRKSSIVVGEAGAPALDR
jgi:hypothetical protein